MKAASGSVRSDASRLGAILDVVWAVLAAVLEAPPFVDRTRHDRLALSLTLVARIWHAIGHFRPGKALLV